MRPTLRLYDRRLPSSTFRPTICAFGSSDLAFHFSALILRVMSVTLVLCRTTWKTEKTNQIYGPINIQLHRTLSHFKFVHQFNGGGPYLLINFMPVNLDSLVKEMYSCRTLMNTSWLFTIFVLFMFIPSFTDFEESSRMTKNLSRPCKGSARMIMSSTNCKCERFRPLILIPHPFQSSVLKTSCCLIPRCNWKNLVLFSYAWTVIFAAS